MGQKKNLRYFTKGLCLRGKRKSEMEEEELIWWTVYKDLATSNGTDKNRRHICYNTLQSESFATGTEHTHLLLLACRRTYVMIVL
jgi:hypothetical protein